MSILGSGTGGVFFGETDFVMSTSVGFSSLGGSVFASQEETTQLVGIVNAENARSLHMRVMADPRIRVHCDVGALEVEDPGVRLRPL